MIPISVSHAPLSRTLRNLRLIFFFVLVPFAARAMAGLVITALPASDPNSRAFSFRALRASSRALCVTPPTFVYFVCFVVKKPPFPVLKLLPLFAGLLLSAHVHAAVELQPDAPATTGSFPLVSSLHAAPLILPADAPEVVRIAARDFTADVERVTGVRPALLTTPLATGPRILIITQPSLGNRWEAFQLSATADTLTVSGSDPRGIAYALYELSRRIGVSPWNWWADVPVTRRDTLALSLGTEPVDQPAVKYRGIFINDEDWGLVPWAAKTFEPGVGNLGPKTYSKIFELLLRLRANTLWPGMHPTTTAFFNVPGNAAAADAYAIVIGSSHAEPMLRNNVGEWTAPKDDYNYVKNRDGVLAYWEQRVKERTSGESLFTLGMRGIHDSPIVGPKDQAERIATVEKIIADQRALLARHLGHGDPAHVAQLFCPYKEVLADYEAGLKVPDDVTLLWPDDNFGYIRRFGTPAEQKRSGGLGVYYHASYLGAPLPWLWIDSLPPALVWTEMTKAYEHGARTFWIVNVGDLKNTERATEFFLDLAWHADRTSPDAPAQFLQTTAARDFGPANAAAIASTLARHQALAFARKPEHLSWNFPKAPYQPTPLTDAEIHTRLAAYASLLRDTEAVAAALPADAHDAFFQLVAYPVASAAAANERYFKAEFARRQEVRGDEPAALSTFAESEAAALRVTELTRRYNEDIAGGKWRGIVMVNGLSKRDWPSFQLPTVLPLDDATALAAVTAQEAARLSASVALGSKLPAHSSGDFYEISGLVSIHAGHFSSQTDVPGGGWRSIPGLGRTGSAVTVLPSTLQGAPRLSYRFHLSTGGPATLRVRLLPTHPLVSGQGLRFAIALDDGQPIPLAVTSGFDPKSTAWKERVLSNATEVSFTFPTPLTAGEHMLHLVAVDPGVVIDKFVIDLGGLTPSYDGPPETRAP